MIINSYLLLNVVLYLILCIFLYRSHIYLKWFMLVIGILFLVSSICSLFYYNSELYFLLTESRSHKISFLPLLYLFICLIIYLLPLKSLRFDKFELPNYTLLVKLSIFIGLCSIIPFFENLRGLSHLDFASMAAQYQENIEDAVDTRSQFSAIGRILNGITNWFQYFTPTLFFYLIAKKKKTIYIILALIAVINPNLASLYHGGRGQIVIMALLLTINYVLFYNFLDKKTKRTINIFGIVFLASGILFIVLMTIARASGDSDLALQGIYRYMGESFVNFSETGYDVKNHTFGHSIINGTGYTFLSNFSDFFNTRDYEGLSNSTGIRMFVYYTVFGDYFLDFGWIGGVIFNITLGALFYMAVHRHLNTISSLVLISMYSKIGLNGIYCYAYMNCAEFVLFTLIVLFFFRRYELQHLKKEQQLKIIYRK